MFQDQDMCLGFPPKYFFMVREKGKCYPGQDQSAIPLPVGNIPLNDIAVQSLNKAAQAVALHAL